MVAQDKDPTHLLWYKIIRITTGNFNLGDAHRVLNAEVAFNDLWAIDQITLGLSNRRSSIQLQHVFFGVQYLR